MLVFGNVYNFLTYSFFLNGRFDIWPLGYKNNKKHSPISIETKNAVDKDVPPILFHNYNRKLLAKLENSGETVQLKPADTNKHSNLPSISGSFLPSNYILDNVHFHWDAEHTIDGKRYSMEGHFVHYDTKRHNLEEALKFNDGVVVLAVLYEEKISFNDTFKEVSKHVRKVAKKVHESVDMPNKITFHNLLPKSTNKFYTYEGSLDWPQAPEVKWIVFEEPSFINSKQLQKISNIYGDNNVRITNNARSVQNLNGREVLHGHHYTFFAKLVQYVGTSLADMFK